LLMLVGPQIIKNTKSSPELIDGPSKYGEDECIVLSLE
jgi:hypothetical protein